MTSNILLTFMATIGAWLRLCALLRTEPQQKHDQAVPKKGPFFLQETGFTNMGPCNIYIYLYLSYIYIYMCVCIYIYTYIESGTPPGPPKIRGFKRFWLLYASFSSFDDIWKVKVLGRCTVFDLLILSSILGCLLFVTLLFFDRWS